MSLRAGDIVKIMSKEWNKVFYRVICYPRGDSPCSQNHEKMDSVRCGSKHDIHVKVIWKKDDAPPYPALGQELVVDSSLATSPNYNENEMLLLALASL